MPRIELISYFCQISTFLGKVRIPARLVYPSNSLARLYFSLTWYSREHRSGKIRINSEFLRFLLGISESRLYRLLKQAKEAEAIRYYRKIRNSSEFLIYLGSIYKFAKASGLKELGTYFECSAPWDAKELKRQAIEAATYDQQFKSEEKARRGFKNKDKAYFEKFSIKSLWDSEEDLLKHLSILNKKARREFKQSGTGVLAEKRSRKGEIIINITKKKIYTNNTAVIYGANQNSIAEAVGCSPRTVQRHQTRLKKKQICIYHADFDKLSQETLDLKGELSTGTYRFGLKLIQNPFPESKSLPLALELKNCFGTKRGAKILTGFDPNRIFKIEGCPQAFYAYTNFYFRSTFEDNLISAPSSRKAYRIMVSENLPKIITLPRQHNSKRAARGKGEKRLLKNMLAGAVPPCGGITDKNAVEVQVQ